MKARLWRDYSCRYWWFLTSGVIQGVTACLVVAVYFIIRSLTSSMDNVETIPTYINAIVVRNGKCYFPNNN